MYQQANALMKMQEEIDVTHDAFMVQMAANQARVELANHVSDYLYVLDKLQQLEDKFEG